MVAGGNRRDQRNQGQIDRIVPRRNDADDAERPVLHFGARRPEQPVGEAMTRARPARQTLAHVVDLVQHGHAVGEQAFVRRAAAEIGAHRCDQFVEAAAQHFAQGAEIAQALGRARVRWPARPHAGASRRAERSMRRVSIHGSSLPPLRCRARRPHFRASERDSAGRISFDTRPCMLTLRHSVARAAIHEHPSLQRHRPATRAGRLCRSRCGRHRRCRTRRRRLDLAVRGRPRRRPSHPHRRTQQHPGWRGAACDPRRPVHAGRISAADRRRRHDRSRRDPACLHDRGRLPDRHACDRARRRASCSGTA